MRRFVMLILLSSSFCWAQESGGFQPATTNVWGAEYPRVDSAGKVQIRVKAPDATKVRLSISGQNSAPPTSDDLEVAKHQGTRVTQVAAALKAFANRT